MFPMELLLALVFTAIISVCDAEGRYCRNGYWCEHGCCGRYDNDCCSAPEVALIAGLCVGIGVLIFIVIIVICICRRQRRRGIVYRQNGGVIMQSNAVVVTQHQTPMVPTTGMHPGVTYPPQQPYPNYAFPTSPPPYAQGPPAYDTLQYNPAGGPGGVSNPGFDSK